jgi:polysaccharide biosynthesis/export protein VpsN
MRQKTKPMHKTKTLLNSALFLLLALALASQAETKRPSASPSVAPSPSFTSLGGIPTTTSQDTSGVPQTNQDYHLRNGDLVETKVYGEDDLSARVRLNENGSVDLPLLPGVSLGGLTQTQACERIRQLYMKDFLVDPLVSLTILEYGKSKVTVLGQVRTPGVYLFPANERLNLLQAIALAGGYARTGAPGKIHIKRVQDGKENVIKVDGRAMAKDEAYKMFEIQPNDVITIAESIW